MHRCRRCNLRHGRLPSCDSPIRYPFFLFVACLVNWAISSRPREPPGSASSAVPSHPLVAVSHATASLPALHAFLGTLALLFA